MVSVRPALVQPANAAASAVANVRHMTFENVRTTTRPPNDPLRAGTALELRNQIKRWWSQLVPYISEMFDGTAEPLTQLIYKPKSR